MARGLSHSRLVTNFDEAMSRAQYLLHLALVATPGMVTITGAVARWALGL